MQDNTTAQIVNQLFERLIAINPAFKQAWPTEHEFQATKKEWIIAFVDAGINSIERVKKGLSKIRLNPSPFIPSPAEFIQLCQPSPEDIGAPDLESAYAEACDHAHPQSWTNTWSHPAVHHAYKKLGSNAFLNICGAKEAEKLLNKFEAHYLQACLDYTAGKIMEQVEQKKQKTKYDHDRSYEENGYKFYRPGILMQYKNISSYEECFAICEKLTGNDSRLKYFISKLENKYKSEGLI